MMMETGYDMTSKQNPMNDQKPHAGRGAPAGNTNARFWGRPEVETARLLIDVWATQVWHSMRLIVPVHQIVVRRIPITDERTGREIGKRLAFETVSRETGQSYVIGGDHRPVAIDERIGGDIVIEHRSTSPFRDRGLASPLEIKVMVDAALKECDPWAAPLLLHLYPRSGPYHEQARTIHTFRPEELVRKLLIDYDGPNPGRCVDVGLGQMHREAVKLIIPIGREVLRGAA